jgi:hypothetical protein
MYIVVVAWIYVVLMVAVVEAVGSGGSLLGAVMTLLWWGLLPLGIVTYVWRAPARRAARRAAQASADTRQPPDGGGHAAGDSVAPERKEP